MRVHVGRRRPSAASTNSFTASRHATTTPNHSTDQDNIARYVIGDMTLDEQIAFEVRMAGDDELAQAVIAASAIDDLLRRAAEQECRGSTPNRAAELERRGSPPQRRTSRRPRTPPPCHALPEGPEGPIPS